MSIVTGILLIVSGIVAIVIIVLIVSNTMVDDDESRGLRACTAVVLSGMLPIVGGFAVRVLVEGKPGAPEDFSKSTYYKVIGVGVINSPTTPVLLQRADNSVVALEFAGPVTVTNGAVCKISEGKTGYVLEPLH